MNLHDSEAAVLAAILWDNRAFETVRLAVEDFGNAEHCAIFRATAKVLNEGREANLLSVTEVLPEPYRARLVNLSGCGMEALRSNVAYYADQVREASRRRRLLLLFEEMKALAERNGQLEVSALLTRLDDGLQALQDSRQPIHTLSDLLPEVVAEVENRLVHGVDPAIGLGLPEMDRLSIGARAGELWVVASRPGIGKTALLGAMALSVTVQYKATVGMFSAEMPGTEIGLRLLSNSGLIDYWTLRGGHVAQEEREDFMGRVVQGATDLSNAARILIDSTSNIQLDDLRVSARVMKRRGAVLLLIDYLTLLRYGDSRMPRYERVGQITKALKQLARELEIPVVVASQLNRDAEDAEPTLSELRQSGEVEEDADVVLLLHRKRGDAEANTRLLPTLCILAKNRSGRCGRFKVQFDPTHMRFLGYAEGA